MLKSQYYIEELKYINNLKLPWELIDGKSILITGATGLIGTVLVDAMVFRNEYKDAQISIWSLTRNEEVLRKRFGEYLGKKYFHYLVQDVSDSIGIGNDIDYIIHCAGKGDPYSFVTDPVGIMNANYQGVFQVLELAKKKKTSKVVYISSGEIYGIPSKDNWRKDGFIENDYGYIDLLIPRSGYSSAKRASETLCSAYIYQYNLNVSIARPCHTYGVTMLESDNRVVGEFLRKAYRKESIVMKSQGLQKRSYCYVVDTVSAILTILLLGENGQAYNIANRESVISIRDLALLIAKNAQLEVEFEEASEFDKKGYSNIERAILDPSKLEKLGWTAKYKIDEGIHRILEEMKVIG